MKYLDMNSKTHHCQSNSVLALDTGTIFSLIMTQQRQPVLLEQAPLSKLTQSASSLESNVLACNFQLIHLKPIYMKHKSTKWVSRLKNGFSSSWPSRSHFPA